MQNQHAAKEEVVAMLVTLIGHVRAMGRDEDEGVLFGYAMERAQSAIMPVSDKGFVDRAMVAIWAIHDAAVYQHYLLAVDDDSGCSQQPL